MLWQDSMQRRLPQRRIEILLAQIAMRIDLCMGGKDGATLSEYLAVIDPPPDPVDEPDAPDVEEQQAAFGFKPINKNPGDMNHGQQPG